MLRKIIEIDEERCNGCGACIPSCAEGALAIVDGKARIVKDLYCDGLGACLGACPQDALRIIEREAEEFDEAAAMDHVRATRGEAAAHGHGHANGHGASPGGCPGSGLREFAAPAAAASPASDVGNEPSELSHWPVQIRLIPPHAPFLKGADLLIAADCAPVAYAGFHRDFLRGRKALIGCPKFDDAQGYIEKLTAIFREAKPTSVTVLRMEVPCCTGLSVIVRKAAELAGAKFPIVDKIVTREGKTADPAPAGLM